MIAIALALLAQSPCTPRAITPLVPVTTESFGREIAVAGDRLLASGDLPAELEEFIRDPATGDWTDTQTIDLVSGGVPALGEILGIAIDGNTAVVTVGGPTLAALVLQRDTTTGAWSVEQQLDAPETMRPDARPVVRDDVILFGTEQRRARVFTRTGGSPAWTTTQFLEPTSPITGTDQRYGARIAYDGRIAIVTASAEASGRAYVYRRTSSGVFDFVQQLAPRSSNVEGFGRSIGIERDALVIGAPTNMPFGGLAEDEGSLEVFRFVPSTQRWVRTQALRGNVGQTNERVGADLAIGAGYIIASSRNSTAGATGSVYAYRIDGNVGLYRLERRIDFGVGAAPLDGEIGRSLTLSGPLALIGTTAPAQVAVLPVGAIDCDMDGNLDGCEILLGQEFDTNRNGLPDPCEETGTRYCSPAVPNSTGVPARMAFFGLPRTALLSVELAAEGLPGGAPGYFMASRTNVVTTNPGVWLGNLCVDGSPVSRRVGGMQIAGGAGRVEIIYNRALLPSPVPGQLLPIQPGDTWYFQYWYLDSGTTPSSNFSDAVEVTFTLF